MGDWGGRKEGGRGEGGREGGGREGEREGGWEGGVMQGREGRKDGGRGGGREINDKYMTELLFYRSPNCFFPACSPSSLTHSLAHSPVHQVSC